MKRPYRVLLACAVAVGTAVAGGVPSPASGAALPPSRDSRPGNTAVLVIDDFGMGHDRQDKPGTKTDNCTIGTNDVGSNGAGDDLPVSGYSHGELVYRVLADALTADLGSGPISVTSTSRPAPATPIETSADWKYPIGGRPYVIRLAAVHTYLYRVDAILAGIRNQIAVLRKEGFERFVLNMSFVVVPCDVVDWLSDSDLDGLLQTYNSMIRDDSTGALKAGLVSYLSPSGELDPSLVRAGAFTATVAQDDTLAALRPYLAGSFYKTVNLQNFVTQERPLSTIVADPAWKSFQADLIQPGLNGATLKVIPVGASGNGVKYPDPKGDPRQANDPANLIRKGLPFPFAPALWDFVVSASADADPSVADRLNSGEVKLDATGPAMLPGSFGTSFAAPRLSALQAKYVAETGTVSCGGTPPLGYVDLTATPVLNLMGSSPWANRGHATWPGICGTFPS